MTVPLDLPPSSSYEAERARLEALLAQHASPPQQEQEQQQEEQPAGDDSTAASATTPRYVRVKPCEDDAEEAEVHAALLALGAQPVPWCPPHDRRCYALDSAFRLAQCPLYQQGRVYGMDVASAAAVWVLAPQPGERVLDLCCCPGLKLCAIADAVLVHRTGSVTGVDVSRTRLSVARQVVVKYKVGRAAAVGGRSDGDGGGDGGWCRLLCADGRAFALGPGQAWDGAEDDVIYDSRAYDWQGMESRGQRRMNKGSRRRERALLRAVLCSPSSSSSSDDAAAAAGMYDRVLVDADCTHDGSVRHMGKVAGLGEDVQTREGGFLSREKLEGLEELQRGLIRNGFRRLRPGGTLVYSTCSLSRRQNEAVVQWLLEQEPAAVMDPITELGRPMHGHGQEQEDEDGQMRAEEQQQQQQPGDKEATKITWLPCRWGDLAGTLVFEPRFGTSGLFVARVRKTQGVSPSLVEG